MIEKTSIEEFAEPPPGSGVIWPEGKPSAQILVSDCVTDVGLEGGGKGDFGYTYFVNFEFDNMEDRDALYRHPDVTNIVNDMRNQLQLYGNMTLREDNDNPDGFSEHTEEIFNQHIIPTVIDSINEKYGLNISGGSVASSMEFEGCTAENLAGIDAGGLQLGQKTSVLAYKR